MNPEDFKKMRLKVGVSQAVLARMLGVSKLTYARWELGRAKPSFLAMGKIKQFMEENGDKLKTSDG